MSKKVTKKKKEEVIEPTLCEICNGKGRVSDTVSCETCKGTGKTN